MTTRARRQPPSWLIRALAYDPQTPEPVKRFLHFFYTWLGFRGLALVTFGSMYIFIGIGLLFHANFDPNLRHTYLPLWFRFSLWAVLGGVAVATALFPGLWKAIGFCALFVGPAERCLSYLWALLTTWDPVYSAGLGLYFILTLTVLLFAAWPEPPGPVWDQ